MKRALPFLVLAALLLAGCSLFYDNYDFVGTWIGHGEILNPDDTFHSIDDVVTFDLDGTFAFDQVFRAYDAAGALVLSAFQRGDGTYAVAGEDSGTLSMDFDDASDPGLTDGDVAFAFSADRRQVTIQPTTIDFPIEFNRVD